jgi:hypothetical protein
MELLIGGLTISGLQEIIEANGDISKEDFLWAEQIGSAGSFGCASQSL